MSDLYQPPGRATQVPYALFTAAASHASYQLRQPHTPAAQCSLSRHAQWQFNADPASYVHPGWIVKSGIQIKNLPRYLISETLIITCGLTLVPDEFFRSEKRGVILLDATSLHWLARLATAIGFSMQLRQQIDGRRIRDFARFLGAEQIDLAYQLSQICESQLSEQMMIFAEQVNFRSRRPFRNQLPSTCRHILAAFCDSVPEAVSQRIRMRFRPGYFNDIDDVYNVQDISRVLIALAPYSSLSDSVKCILRS